MKCVNCGHDVDEVHTFSCEVDGQHDRVCMENFGGLCDVCSDAAMQAVKTVLGIMKRRP